MLYCSITKIPCALVLDASNETMNGMAWLRAEAGEQGFNSMNLQSVGMFPWMQQRFDPAGLRNDLSQQYQAMLSAGLQNCGSGELLKHQLVQFQQPAHYLQHSGGSHNPLPHQQQVVPPSVPSNMLPLQTQMLSDNMQRSSLPQQVDTESEGHHQHHNYQEAFLVQPSDIPSPSFTKSEFANSDSKFSASMAHSGMQNMLGTLCPEGSGNLLNFSRTGQFNEQSSQQSWVAKFAQSPASGGSNTKSFPPYSGKDASIDQETCGLDMQNQVLFGANIDSSSLLLPTTVSSIGTSSVHPDMFSMPLGSSGYQSPLYGYVQDSSDMLHSTGQVDQPTPARTFVKVLVREFCFLGFELKSIYFVLYYVSIDLFFFFFRCRSIKKGPLVGHWTLPVSTAIRSCDWNWVGCSGFKGCLKTIKDQAGSLYSLTGRMTRFSLATTHGSKYLT